MRMLEKFYFMVCFMCMLAMPVQAYIDPSVAAYAVQAIAGVAVAVGAVAGIVLHKVKRKVQDKLGIDENVNKEVEEDIEIY